MSSWLGRNGMNGSGGWVPIRVGLNDINAYYDGTQVQIGHNQAGAWISSMDVVAHEFGHGVDDKTPGGISGGGTQEFIGDALAAATEYYDGQLAPYDAPDHTVGEEVNLVGQGPIRDGSNPANVGDPSLLHELDPDRRGPRGRRPRRPLVLPARRAAASPSATAQSVTGLGEQAAIKVLYNAMLMKTTSSNYLKYRTWTLTAAKNLDSTCAQFNAVKDAWNAVNVPAQTADPTCGGTTTPPAHRWQHPAATRASSPARRPGPAPPARSPTTPVARPAPARGSSGSAATAPRHRDGQPVGDRPVHRDRGHAVVLDPHRHRRERLDGRTTRCGCRSSSGAPPPRCAPSATSAPTRRTRSTRTT